MHFIFDNCTQQNASRMPRWITKTCLKCRHKDMLLVILQMLLISVTTFAMKKKTKYRHNTKLRQTAINRKRYLNSKLSVNVR